MEQEAMSTRVAELGGNPHQVDHSEVMELVQRGWINLDDMTFGDWLGSITPSGRDAASRLDAERNDVAQRRIALRDELLQWLYSQIHIHDAQMPLIDAFLKTDTSYLGVPFTDADLVKASDWLAQTGYIGGIGAHGRTILRATLEPKGVAVVERGGSVMDDKSQVGATFNTTVNGAANIANQSTNVTQIIDQSVTWFGKAATVLDSVEQALPALGLAEPDVVTALIVEARDAVASEDAPGTKSKLERLLPFLSSTTAGALGNLVSNGIAQLLTLVP